MLKTAGARRGLALVIAAVALARPLDASEAAPQPRTLVAWRAYIAEVERRIARELDDGGRFLASDYTPDAEVVRSRVGRGEHVITKVAPPAGHADVPGGQISHWRGSLLVPRVTLDQLLHHAQHPPEGGPHQEDVVALRVLERDADRLRLAIRMRRTRIVTVVYDTEHDVEYRRHAAERASSRSLATRIVEIDRAGTPNERAKRPEDDRGFLWRLHSYWRYVQVDAGVIVELESVTLSRSVPFGLSFVLQPIIDDIARESIRRTLTHLQATAGGLATTRAR
jgi:hypothetical protein